MVAAGSSQCAETMRTLFGLGMALAQAASSPIHGVSSSKTGAPCAAKMTGMALVTGCPSGSRVVIRCPSFCLHASAAADSDPSTCSSSLRFTPQA